MLIKREERELGGRIHEFWAWRHWSLYVGIHLEVRELVMKGHYGHAPREKLKQLLPADV